MAEEERLAEEARLAAEAAQEGGCCDAERFCSAFFDFTLGQWEFQDPKMEVLYHIRPYFAGDIPLHKPYIGLIYGRYLQFRFLKWPLIGVVKQEHGKAFFYRTEGKLHSGSR